MPTTNPYSYDAPVVDINKGSKPSTDSTYVTQTPTTVNGFTPPNASPPSFGGPGSALASTNDWGTPPAQPAPAPSAPPAAANPTSWTPPPTGTLSHPAPTGYNSPTPPPGMAAPTGTTWVTDGHGNYGWGTAGYTGSQTPVTGVSNPVSGQAPVTSGANGFTFGTPQFGATQGPVMPVTNPVAPAGNVSQSPIWSPPPTDFWTAAGNPSGSAPYVPPPTPPPIRTVTPVTPVTNPVSGAVPATGTQTPVTNVANPVSGQTPVVSGTNGATFGAPTIGPASAQPNTPQGAPTGYTLVPATSNATGVQQAATPVTTPVSGQTPVVSGTNGMTFGSPTIGNAPAPAPAASIPQVGGGTLQHQDINTGVPHNPVAPPATTPPPVTTTPPPPPPPPPTPAPTATIPPPPTPAPTAGMPGALPLPTPPPSWNMTPAPPTTNPVPYPTRVPMPGDTAAPIIGTPDYRYPSDPAYYSSPTAPPGAAPGPGVSWVTDGQGHYFWGTPSPAGVRPPGDVHLQTPGPQQPPPPWAQALQGGYNLPSFVNPDMGAGTIPTTQQWANFSPTEMAAVASLNWSTTGMTSEDLNNYMMRSSPQWATPGPAVYKSY